MAERDSLDDMIAKRTERNPQFRKLLGAARRRRVLLRALAEQREVQDRPQAALAADMATPASAVVLLESTASDAKISTVDRYAASLGYVVQYHLIPAEDGVEVPPVVVHWLARYLCGVHLRSRLRVEVQGRGATSPASTAVGQGADAHACGQLSCRRSDCKSAPEPLNRCRTRGGTGPTAVRPQEVQATIVVPTPAIGDDLLTRVEERRLSVVDVSPSTTSGLLGPDLTHEHIEIFCDPASGLRGAIAVHSTTLGPAMGGVRRAAYVDADALVNDAMLLSRAMTFKNAAAGLDLGGGKAVVLDDGHWPTMREPRLRAFARIVDRLGGRYIAAEDVGTTPADMATIAEGTRWVAGRPTTSGGMGDPSPATARSVFGSVVAAVDLVFGDPSLAERSVGVLGLGAVGSRLARMLGTAGAQLVVADVDGARAQAAASGLGARVVAPADLLHADVDVLAPCALGGVISRSEAQRLHCRIVAGAANNPLTDDRVADELHARGVLYVPDFLANCGGIIHVGAEVLGFTTDDVDARIRQAIERTADVLRRAAREGAVPLDLARAEAMHRLAPRTEVRA